LGVRALVGVKIAPEFPDKDTVPETGVSPNSFTVNVVVFKVVGFIASLNCTAKLLPAATPVAPLSGETELTVGAGPAVEKVQV
jgi:hypothetical protein